MRVLIVDDEALARGRAAREARRPSGGRGGRRGGERLRGGEASPRSSRPTCVLARHPDAEARRLRGARAARRKAPAVVFVTAYDEYALRAFEVHAVDYLLKPVEPERLGDGARAGRASAWRAAGRGRRRRPAGRGGRAAARAAARARAGPRGGAGPRPAARQDRLHRGARRLPGRSRWRASAYRKQQTIGELEAQLDPRRFVRVHRSYLLNLERLARLELYAKDSWIAILADGTRMPVSRTGHARLEGASGMRLKGSAC